MMTESDNWNPCMLKLGGARVGESEKVLLASCCSCSCKWTHCLWVINTAAWGRVADDWFTSAKGDPMCWGQCLLTEPDWLTSSRVQVRYRLISASDRARGLHWVFLPFSLQLETRLNLVNLYYNNLTNSMKSAVFTIHTGSPASPLGPG